MKILFCKIKYFLLNILTFFLNLLFPRDESIVLFGAWMGYKFADNPRNLYVYMNEKKEEIGLNRVIWVTRNIDLYHELLDNNYEVYMMHSFRSFYYHLKAKTHIICNMHYQSGNYKGDIMGCLSFGALKINLWHGIGVKATGYLRKDISHRKKKKINFLEQINSCFFTPGSWKNAYFLATSEENKRVLENDNGIEKNKIIVSTYPRHCKYQFYLQNEKKIRKY